VVMYPRSLGEMLHTPRKERPVPQDLVICSLCLHVQRGSEWIEAERVIRETRSYELDATPRFHPAICDNCVDSILRRRAVEHEEPLAA
jgi:hypothetical protein